jgi:hypothetical protein
MPRYFTLESANETLLTLKPIIQEILEIRQSLLERQPEVWPVVQKSIGNGGSKAASQAALEVKRLNELTREIHESGALLKDINIGLLDFPCLREGREVYLCWRFGEDNIAYWHELDAGYSGRQLL